MDTKLKGIIALATLVLVLGTGARWMRPSSRKLAQTAQRTSPTAFQIPLGSAMPDISGMLGGQGTMYTLITKYRLEPRIAMFISQAKMKMLDQSNTSVHYLLTFPNGVTSEDTITITPHQKYTPTAAELSRAKRPGRRIYGAKLSVKKTGPQEALFTLHYYVLQASLPPEFQKVNQESSASLRPAKQDFFQFVPSVYAQESGNNGEGVATGEMSEFVKTEVVKGLEIAEKEKLAKFADNILSMKDLVMGYKEIQGWLGEVEELTDCAEHPTNPVTQKALSTSEYQQQVLGPLDDTSWDVQMSAFPKVSNIAAGALTQFMEGAFGAGLLVAPLTALNDEAIASIMEDEINDAKKGVTPCHHEKIQEGQFRPMQANITYAYKHDTPEECRNYSCVRSTAEASFEGSAQLTPNSEGYLTGEGSGTFRTARSQHAHDNYCKSAENREKSSGPGTIKILAGGDSPLNGVIRASLDTDDLKEQTESTGCNGATNSTSAEHGAYGVSCEFHNVDLVHGGIYSAFDSGNFHGTCKLEIFPK